jgi:hypothetical protein
MSSIAIFVVVYLIPCVIILSIMNYSVFINKEEVTIGGYIGFTVLALFPVMNVIVCMAFIIMYIDEFAMNCKAIDRFKAWLDKPLLKR